MSNEPKVKRKLRAILSTDVKGYSLTYVEESKKAIRLMRRAFRLNPIPPVYYYAWMGMAYETDGQYENAIEQCKKAIDLNPYLYGS